MNLKNGMAFYINLEGHENRKDKTVKELEKINIKYERFNAIKEEFNALGCLKSHHQVIKNCIDMLKQHSYKWFLIVEDDVKWNFNTPEILDKLNFIDKNIELAPVWHLIESINGKQPDIHDNFPFIKYFKKAPYDGHTRGTMNCTTAYIIRSDYLETLFNAWTKSIKIFEQGIELRKNNIDPGYPLWWYNADCEPWVSLQVKDKWFLLPIVIQSGEPSTICTKSFNKMYDKLSKTNN